VSEAFRLWGGFAWDHGREKVMDMFRAKWLGLLLLAAACGCYHSKTSGEEEGRP
jgi:hypothetical protein